MLNSKYLVRLLDDPQSAVDLRAYYGREPGVPPHPGQWFDLLVPKIPNTFTATDMLAVQCLGAVVPIAVAIELVHGELGEEVGTLLRTVPTDLDLGTGDAADAVAAGSPADRAWRLLADHRGAGKIVADRLLARKRPRLMPVWDQVVRCALGRPQFGGVWESLDRVVRRSDGGVGDRLARLHEKAELDERVSLLRVLDVAVWMRHRATHRPHDCPGLDLHTGRHGRHPSSRGVAGPAA